MLLHSSAALSLHTVVAAAIARPSRTRCAAGVSGEKTERDGTVGARGSKRADLKKTSTSCELLLLLQQQKIYSGYTTRNGKFKRLERHLQLSATGSASREGTETAVALLQSRECTKVPISALPDYSAKGNFGDKSRITEYPTRKIER